MAIPDDIYVRACCLMNVGLDWELTLPPPHFTIDRKARLHLLGIYNGLPLLSPFGDWLQPGWDTIDAGESLVIGVEAMAASGIQKVAFTITPDNGLYDGVPSKTVNVSVMTYNAVRGCFGYFTTIDTDDFSTDTRFTVSGEIYDNQSPAQTRDKDTGMGSVASSTLTLNSNPGVNQTVIICDRVYRFRGSLAEAGDVLIGSTAAESRDNLVAAINGTGTPGTQYHADTIPHHPCTAAAGTGDTMVLESKEKLNAANGYIVDETLSDSLSVWDPAGTLDGGEDDEGLEDLYFFANKTGTYAKKVKYVDWDNGNDGNSGDSEGAAYKTVNQAFADSDNDGANDLCRLEVRLMGLNNRCGNPSGHLSRQARGQWATITCRPGYSSADTGMFEPSPDAPNYVPLASLHYLHLKNITLRAAAGSTIAANNANSTSYGTCIQMTNDPGTRLWLDNVNLIGRGYQSAFGHTANVSHPIQLNDTGNYWPEQTWATKTNHEEMGTCLSRHETNVRMSIANTFGTISHDLHRGVPVIVRALAACIDPGASGNHADFAEWKAYITANDRHRNVICSQSAIYKQTSTLGHPVWQDGAVAGTDPLSMAFVGNLFRMDANSDSQLFHINSSQNQFLAWHNTMICEKPGFDPHIDGAHKWGATGFWYRPGDYTSGTLSTRSSDTEGVVTSVGHGLEVDDIVNVKWDQTVELPVGGGRWAMAVTAVSGNDVTVAGGTGDAFPAQSSAVEIGGPDTPTTIANCSVKGNTWSRGILLWPQVGNWQVTVDESGWDHNHAEYVGAGNWQEWHELGTNFTNDDDDGPAVYTDDYHPVGSPLVNRITPLLRPYDLDGEPFVAPAPLGALIPAQGLLLRMLQEGAFVGGQ